MIHYKKHVIVFSLVLFTAAVSQSCIDSSAENQEAILGMLALMQSQTSSAVCEVKENTVTFQGITYTKSGSGTAVCSGSLLQVSGEVHLSALNVNHPLLSAQVGYKLTSDLSSELSVMGGISQPAAENPLISFGHGFAFTAAAAKFKGLSSDGNSVIEGNIAESGNAAYVPGTESQKICAEVHMGTAHTDVHVLINWTNQGCDGITSEAQAEAEFDAEGREAPASLGEKKYFGFIIKNAALESVSLYAQPPKFAH